MDIAQASCLLSKVNTGSSSCERVCDFFYFWLRSKLCEKVKNITEVRNIMQQIYQKLGDPDGKCEYKDLNSNVQCSEFKRAKTVFDYYQDYKTIKKQLKNCTTPGSPCTGAYKTYLQTADGPYREVQASSPDSGHEYYDRIVREIKDNGGKIPKPSDLKWGTVLGEELPPDGEGEANLDNCFQHIIFYPPGLVTNLRKAEAEEKGDPPSNVTSTTP
ncbi:KIR protein [Plasmodium coatneyi]|uniref:KIR protein n=1 Tax=Plasmodium coatneyi TaxID=208452 RepID=A0A1B1E5Z1_9APIC|nr:KIR protein [Plasmodium coatneyi]ANQ10454.1 KIR protein [Plasmodium coatneyi]